MAALTVVAGHTHLISGSYGRIALDSFFVLSAFLLTGPLLTNIGASGWVTTFYLRRGARIWPLYYAVAAWCIFTSVPNQVRPAWPLLFQLDLVEAGIAGDHARRSALGVLWTVGTEEKFYVLLPLLLWATIRFSGAHRVPAVMLGSAALSIAARVLTQAPVPRIVMFHTRFDAVAFGAVAAWLARSRPHWGRFAVLPAVGFLAGAFVMSDHLVQFA